MSSSEDSRSEGGSAFPASGDGPAGPGARPAASSGGGGASSGATTSGSGEGVSSGATTSGSGEGAATAGRAALPGAEGEAPPGRTALHGAEGAAPPGRAASAGAEGAATAAAALAGVSFSHIYVEEAAAGYPDAARILKLFPDAVRIPIADYKELFGRSGQHFQLQKRSNKLILAVKKDNFLYRGSERINSFGDRFLYYNSLIRNCLYNCDYCFLQGMHPSAYIVVFVNGEDFFAGADRHLSGGPLYLSISYLTDLLGFEGLVPFCRRWIEFAAQRPDLTIEIRTKSDNYRAIRDLKPIPNVVLSWTMSPERIAVRYEHGTASFKNRLFAARSALEDGWRVRICFDPLLRVSDWREQYAGCIEELFRRIPPGAVEGFSVGVLRMSPSHLKAMRAGGARSEILYHPLRVAGGVATYSPREEHEMRSFVREEIAGRAGPARITLVGG